MLLGKAAVVMYPSGIGGIGTADTGEDLERPLVTDAVQHVHTVLASVQNPLVPHVRQMLGRDRLLDLESLEYLGDRAFISLLEQMQDAQPQWVTEAPQHPRGRFNDVVIEWLGSGGAHVISDDRFG
jgi:hypothetical protein